MHKHPQTVLGLHPSSQGFGWAFFEDASSLFDWGVPHIKIGNRNAGSLARIEKLFDKYKPAIVALEEFEKATTGRAGRIRLLCRDIGLVAKKRGIMVRIYSRAQIEDTFPGTVAKHRIEVANAVAERLPVLRERLPKPRREWESEKPAMALFAAVACALTCYANMPG